MACVYQLPGENQLYSWMVLIKRNSDVCPGVGMTMRVASVQGGVNAYRGTSLIRNSLPLGTFSSPMPRDLW